MATLIKRIPKVHIFWVLIFFLFMAALGLTFTPKCEVVMLAQSGQSSCGTLNIISHQAPAHSQTQKIFTLPKNKLQTIRIPLEEPPAQTDTLLITPDNTIGNEFTIHYLSVKKRGFHPLSIDVNRLKTNSSLTRIGISNVLRLKTLNTTPQISATIPAYQFKIDWTLIIIYLLSSITVSALLIYGIPYFFRNKLTASTYFFCSAILLVTVLLFIMATTARHNASPDEHNHFLAAEYFKTNSKTPAKCITKAAYTHSHLWNQSRANSPGAQYLLAGKFSNLFEGLFTTHKSVRFAGIILFLSFALLAACFPKQKFVLLPALFVPQLWYLFSYINDGYLPIYLSFVLIILTEALKKHLLPGRFNKKTFYSILLIGFLLGWQMLSKKNNYAFTLFYLFYLFTLPIDFNISPRQIVSRFWKIIRPYAKVPLAIVLLATLLVLFRLSTTEKQNGDMPAEIEQFYQQSEINNQNHLDKGVSGYARFGSYVKMMPEWTIKTSTSFIGCYGFMKYKSTKTFYMLYVSLAFIMITTIGIYIVRSRQGDLLFWALVFVLVFVALCFASSYFYSYRYDFQAQGRYLFPALPVLGLFFHKLNRENGKKLIQKTVLPITFVLFLMGIYSFVHTGILSLYMP